MKIAEYHTMEHPEIALQYLTQCKWEAAQLLAKLIRTHTEKEMMGENPRFFFLMDGDQVVSFATLTHQDAVQDEALYPWVGFVHTDPAYRGHRYSKLVIDHALALAKSEGYSRAYLTTDLTGFYERYGFIYLENRPDLSGEDSRVYYYPLR